MRELRQELVITDMKHFLVRTVAFWLAVNVFMLYGMCADEGYHVRHGVRIPVEGTVRPVAVSDVDWPENYRPIDSEGWSVFRATPDTRILYVAADGDDASAVVYGPDDPAVGADPFNPGKDIKPFHDINTALKKQRPGMPDWILLKRGDTWRGPITEQNVPPGKSAKDSETRRRVNRSPKAGAASGEEHGT